MKIIRANRGEGKTTELVKRSNKEWKYIICKDRQRVEVIEDVARRLNLNIPFPITVHELPLQSHYIKSVLIDDIEDVLEYLIQRPIDFVTTSCKIENL